MDLPPGQPRLTRRTPRALVYRKANRRRRWGAAAPLRQQQQLRIYDLRMQLIIQNFFRDCYLRFWGSRLHTLAHTIHSALGLFFGIHTRHYLSRALPGGARAHTVHGGKWWTFDIIIGITPCTIFHHGNGSCSRTHQRLPLLPPPPLPPPPPPQSPLNGAIHKWRAHLLNFHQGGH